MLLTIGQKVNSLYPSFLFIRYCNFIFTINEQTKSSEQEYTSIFPTFNGQRRGAFRLTKGHVKNHIN